jgi:cohesin loading factor subunit SCC2
MAENFSAFDYKTQEEVLTILKHLTSVLSTAGMQLLAVLSPSHLLTQLGSQGNIMTAMAVGDNDFCIRPAFLPYV